jgi:membrane protease YdiL (CAAX protease family)
MFSMTSHLKNGLSYGLLVVAFFAAVKHLAPHFGAWQSLASILVISFEIYLPFIVIEREKKSLRSYALGLPGNWQEELKSALWFSFLTLLPYAIIAALTECLLARTKGFDLIWTFPWQAIYPNRLLSQVFAIALPEEIFFRGFLQTYFVRAWPSPYRLFGLPIGKATLAVNVLFALAHFVGEYAPSRLLPFLPGLLFSALTLRSGSIFSAVIYHSLCNIVSELLSSGFSISQVLPN